MLLTLICLGLLLLGFVTLTTQTLHVTPQKCVKPAYREIISNFWKHSNNINYITNEETKSLAINRSSRDINLKITKILKSNP